MTNKFKEKFVGMPIEKHEMRPGKYRKQKMF